MKAEIDHFLTNIEGEIIAQQQNRGLRASGASADSLRHTATETEGEIVGSGYFVQQIKGRRPGTLPPVSAIQDWIKAKGLDLNPWAVAVNMKKKGTTIFRGERQGLDIGSAVEKHRQEFVDSLVNAESLVIKATISNAFKQAQAALV